MVFFFLGDSFGQRIPVRLFKPTADPSNRFYLGTVRTATTSK